MSLFRKEYNHYLGYALSGGGARGFAHLGALKVFEVYNLKPDILVGTSAGALAGVFYADGFTPEEIAELFQHKDFKDFAEFTFPKTGLFKNSGLDKFLKNNLRSTTFEQLQIPFKAVATNWLNGSVTVFGEGDKLIDAVVASCTVPLVFNPKIIDDVPYVDGGLLKNFPVSVIRNECKFVFGVNVSLTLPMPEKANMKNTAERVFKLMSNSNTIIDRNMCDVLVETESFEKYFMFDLKNIETIMELGYDSTIEALSTEKSLKIIRRCNRYSELEQKVKKNIKLIKSISK